MIRPPRPASVPPHPGRAGRSRLMGYSQKTSTTRTVRTLARLEQASGCEIDTDSAGGFHPAHCPTFESRARLLAELAREDARTDGRVRRVALEIARGARSGEPEDLAPAIHAYVRDRVRYLDEAIQTFQTASDTLDAGGNCANSTRLILALAFALGVPAELYAREGTGGNKGHACAKLWDGSSWRWAEASIPALFGESPTTALRRLAAAGLVRGAARADIGRAHMGAAGDTSPSDQAIVAAVNAIQANGVVQLSAPSKLMVQAIQSAIAVVAPDLTKAIAGAITEAVGASLAELGAEVVGDVAGAIPLIGQMVSWFRTLYALTQGAADARSEAYCQLTLSARAVNTAGAANSVRPCDLFTETGVWVVGPSGVVNNQKVSTSSYDTIPAVGRALRRIFETDWSQGVTTKGWSAEKYAAVQQSVDDNWPGPFAENSDEDHFLTALGRGNGGIPDGNPLPFVERNILRNQYNIDSGENVGPTKFEVSVAVGSLIKAITAQAGVVGSDGGVSLWGALLDACQQMIDMGSMTPGFAAYLMNHYYGFGPTRVIDTSECDWSPVVADVFRMLSGWQNTLHPTYKNDQDALALVLKKSAPLPAAVTRSLSRPGVITFNVQRDAAITGVRPDVYARGVVLRAFATVKGAPSPSPSAVQAFQAICRAESFYGRGWKPGSAMQDSHNWGAIQCARPVNGTCPANTGLYQDSHADGTKYTACFCRYASDDLGCQAVLKTLVSKLGANVSVLGSGDADRIAAAMKAKGYFELATSEYADGIATNAQKIATALGEPVAVTRRKVAAPLIAFIVGAAGLGGALYLDRNPKAWAAVKAATDRAKRRLLGKG
jgi:hypothetical protein